MWKGLKRWWGKGRAEGARDPGDDPAWAAQLLRAPDPEPPPVAQLDPLQEALAELDAEVAERGAEAGVAAMRDVLLRAPTDPRVLRRAAAVLRALGDEALATGFDQAAATSHGQPLLELSLSFLDMDDALLALALADGALARERGWRQAVLTAAEALARMGLHRRALARLATVSLGDDAGLAVRTAVSAVLAHELERFAAVASAVPEGETWVHAAAARAAAFPPAPAPSSAEAARGEAEDDAAPAAEAPEADDPRQRMLFTLYGSVLLDDASEGEELDALRISRWLAAVAELVKGLLPPDTRPAWVSPRGEVLARWLGSLLPVKAALPLSARLPRQPVLVVVADDEDLATLYETKAWFEAPAPLFQALKDPAELGSPMADIIGVWRPRVTLPFAGLDAERAADRLPPKMLATRLETEAGRVNPSELQGFLAWARQRRDHLSLVTPPAADDRVRQIGDLPSAD